MLSFLKPAFDLSYPGSLYPYHIASFFCRSYLFVSRIRKGATEQPYVVVKMDTSITRNIRDKITKLGTRGMRNKADLVKPDRQAQKSRANIDMSDGQL